jgi:predicted nuclease of predicted toxin-antitoxin system
VGESGASFVNDPFLIDECLSPDLVALANARNHDATHIVYRGLQGTLDPDLMPVIRDGNFILVTNNGKDFLPLYAKEEVHPGLVIIIPGSLEREKQVEFFGLVLDVIEPMPDIVNKVVEIFSDGSVEVRDWPELGSKPTIPGNV